MSGEREVQAFRRSTLAISVRMRHCARRTPFCPSQIHILIPRAVIMWASICSILLVASEGLAAKDGGTDGFDFNDGTTHGWTMTDASVYPSDIPLRGSNLPASKEGGQGDCDRANHRRCLAAEGTFVKAPALCLALFGSGSIWLGVTEKNWPITC